MNIEKLRFWEFKRGARTKICPLDLAGAMAKQGA